MLTNSKQVENLEARIAQLESILDSINDGFFTLDKNFNFTYVNKAFERICGYPREHIIGINYWEQFPHAVDLKFYPEYNTAFEEQRTVQFEEYAISMGCWVSVTVYPSEEGLSVYFVDVTAQRTARKTIEAQNKSLLEIAQIQSHKVRKPVASILGLAPLLDTSNPCAPSNLKVIQGIIESCKELDITIKEMDARTRVIIEGK